MTEDTGGCSPGISYRSQSSLQGGRRVSVVQSEMMAEFKAGDDDDLNWFHK